MYIVNTLFKSRQMFSPCLFVYFLQYATCILNGPSSTAIYHLSLPQKKQQQFMQIFLYCTIYVCDKYVYTSFLYTMNKDFVHVNNKNKANIEFILQFVYR